MARPSRALSFHQAVILQTQVPVWWLLQLLHYSISFYKNGIDGDFLGILDHLVGNKKVVPDFLQQQGLPLDQANMLEGSVITTEGTLGSLEEALSEARINVSVTETAGGAGIPSATVRLLNLNDEISCDNCDPDFFPENLLVAENGEATFKLSGIPSVATEIDLLVTGVPGYVEMPATTQVVASANVTVEIVMAPAYKLTVEGAGDGAGTLTSSPDDISCSIDSTIDSGTCSADFATGTEVTLIAYPTEGSAFTAWSGGGCSGLGPTCTVTMDQAHTVTAFFALQCIDSNYSISPPEHSFTATGGAGSITMVAPSSCNWSASKSATWITIDSGSNGSGNGTVNYTVTANTETISRTTTITVAGKNHEVTQDPRPCVASDYSISPLSRPFTFGADTGTIDVAATSDCEWITSESASWITITSGASGNGNGTVSYTITANTSTSPRSAIITAAGRSHEVTQDPRPCVASDYAISPTSRSFTSDADTGTIDVVATSGCGWNASESANWITITSGSNGIGNGTVGYSVTVNTGASSRTAIITAAGNSHTVTQDPAPCTYSISPNSLSFDGRGGLGRVSVTTRSDCSWSSSGIPSWIAITSGDGSGSGDGEVTYWVYENTGTTTRSATITIAGNSHAVDQTPCTYSISSTNNSFPSSGGTGVIGVASTNRCAWNASENASWITITAVSNNDSGYADGEVAYTVSANTTSSIRTAIISVAGKSYTVTQGPVLVPPLLISPNDGSFLSSCTNAVWDFDWSNVQGATEYRFMLRAPNGNIVRDAIVSSSNYRHSYSPGEYGSGDWIWAVYSGNDFEEWHFSRRSEIWDFTIYCIY